MAHRFASVADSEKDQIGRPKRRLSSAPTHSASAFGNIVVMPPSTGDPLLHRRDGGGRGVAGHGAGVSEGEVDVLVPVDVGDPAAAGGAERQREAARPHVHPGHRHPAEQVVGGPVRGQRSGMFGAVALPLPIQQPAQHAGVDDHGRTVPDTEDGAEKISSDYRWPASLPPVELIHVHHCY